MTFWSHLAEDASLLEDAGYAVINFTPFGGGEVTADGDPDFLGLRGPLTVPADARRAARLRARRPLHAADRARRSLSLAGAARRPTPSRQATRRRSVAHDRHRRRPAGARRVGLAAAGRGRLTSLPTAIVLPDAPDAARAGGPPLYVATWPEPIDVLLWTSIPRYALVNLEIGTNNDPGPCVELGRARRTEIVSYDTVHRSGRSTSAARAATSIPTTAAWRRTAPPTWR